MYKKHMTEEQSRKLKREMWQHIHNGIRVEQMYPTVDAIDIEYVLDYTSFAGKSHEERTWHVTPQSEIAFVIECLNRECTSVGFDLRNVISTAIHRHQTEVHGKMRCEGQEAPDHPEQCCDGHLEYSIRIKYK